MEQDASKSALLYKLWAWFETSKRQIVLSAVAVVIAGFIVSFYMWHESEKELTAGESLSNLLAPGAVSSTAKKESPEALLRVAADYDGTSAAGRALLDAGAGLFSESKFSEARAQFQRFLREYSASPFAAQALLGVAACFDAEGKTSDAATGYRDLIDHHPTENVTLQAKFALARIYESQGKMDQALNLYEELGRADAYGSLGSEAGMRAEELKLKYPKSPPPPTASQPLMTPLLAAPATNKP